MQELWQQYSDFDDKHIWHPFTQEKISPRPFLVNKAEAEFLYIVDHDGKEKKIIDGISSWWVNIHGHCHPYIKEKIKEQLDLHEQVIFSGFTHEPAVKLVNKLLALLPRADITANQDKITNLQKAFFSDNGSTAVEVGVKMAVQYFYNQGQEQKHRIIAFKDGYHGDTVGSMSIGNSTIFHRAFNKLLFPVDFVRSPAPNTNELESKVSEEDRERAEIRSLEKVERLLKINRENYAAVVIEPLVQAAGGMKFHRPQFLQKLRALTKKFNVLLIADEVFTGFGRTGADFACKQACIVPDIICLSKALTGGFLPMGLTFTSNEVYSAFYDDSKLKTFFHGHSYTGNSLSCAAALASLELYEQENRLEDVKFINKKMNLALKQSDLGSLEYIKDLRILGAIAAIEFDTGEGNNYLSDLSEFIKKHFLERGILLRPLGNVLYFMPPYTISNESLDYCLNSIIDFASSIPNELSRTH